MFAPPGTPESVDIQKRLTAIDIGDWLQNDVFHARWWILVAIVLVSWIVWCILLDKKRLKEVCLFAALAAIMALALDEYGDELILWEYPVDINPIFRPLTSINLMILPLSYSLVYQRFSGRRSYVLVSLLVTALICFILEPALAWGGLYHLVNWHYAFSFPFYFLMAMLARCLVNKIRAVSNRSRPSKESLDSTIWEQ